MAKRRKTRRRRKTSMLRMGVASLAFAVFALAIGVVGFLEVYPRLISLMT